MSMQILTVRCVSFVTLSAMVLIAVFTGCWRPGVVENREVRSRLEQSHVKEDDLLIGHSCTRENWYHVLDMRQILVILVFVIGAQLASA